MKLMMGSKSEEMISYFLKLIGTVLPTLSGFFFWVNFSIYDRNDMYCIGT